MQRATTETPDTTDDAPKLTQADFERARYRIGERPVTRAQWQRAVRTRTRQLPVDLLLDEPVIEYFKAIAGERDFRALINDTLRRAIASEHPETDLGQVVRDESAERR